jgi:uncharacterized membrane protein YfcA
MVPVALSLAALIGLSLGLLGSGGSIVTLPVLVYVAHVPAHEAVGMSLVIVGGTSALGTVLQMRRGYFDARAALFFALSGTIGAYFGSKFTRMVSGETLLVCFGFLMLIVGGRMALKGQDLHAGKKCRPVRCLLIGILVGALTGFLGVGGGFVILPALVIFAGLEMKTAVGTSLAVIAINSAAGFLGQLTANHLDWVLTLEFLASAAVGMWMGVALVKRVPSVVLHRTFAGVILLLGIFLIAKNAASMKIL